MLALLLVLGFCAGSLCGVVAFYQWALTKRIARHRKVLDYVGGALRIQNRELQENSGELSEFGVRQRHHRERIEALEAALKVVPPEDNDARNLSGKSGFHNAAEMGASSVEEAVTVWKRIMDEDD